MNENFLNYEQSLALKELGFDEPCVKSYVGISNNGDIKDCTYVLINIKLNNDDVSAPLKQQAFRWFREKHNLNGILNHYPNTKLWDFSVHNLLWNGKEFIEHVRKEDRSVKYSTYEEAEDACINHCIKIIKLLKLK